MKNDTLVKYLTIFGFFILVLVAGILLLSALMFIFGVGINPMILLISICVSIGVLFFLSYAYFRDTWIIRGLLLVLVLSIILIPGIVISGIFFDVSSDGMGYHQSAIIYLVKNGWNPIRESLPSHYCHAIWANHYSKGMEYCAASLYALTDKIEYGKVFNYLSLLAAFFVVVRLLLSLKPFGLISSILVGLIAAFNPVALGQLLTYFVDGQLASYLTVLAAASVSYFLQRDKASFAMICLAIVIVCNIKLTGVAYAVVITGGLWGAICLYDRVFRWREAVILLVSGIVAVILVGFNPYITNIRNHGNPFYPAVGGEFDVLTRQWPFEERDGADESRFIRLFKSLYYSPETGTFTPYFHLMKRRIYWGLWDSRVAGFGPIFNIIISITLISLIVFMLAAWRKNRRLFIWFGYYICILVLSIFITRACWWARMAPQLWLVPVSVIVMAMHLPLRTAPFFYAMCALFLINIGQCVYLMAGVQISSTQMMNSQLNELKNAEQPVQFYPGVECFQSLAVRLQEHGISSIEVGSMSQLTLPNRLALVRPDTDFIVAYRKKKI